MHYLPIKYQLINLIQIPTLLRTQRKAQLQVEKMLSLLMALAGRRIYEKYLELCRNMTKVQLLETQLSTK